MSNQLIRCGLQSWGHLHWVLESTADLEAALGVPKQDKAAKLQPGSHGRIANLRLVLAANLAAVHWGPLSDVLTDGSALLPLLASAQACPGWSPLPTAALCTASMPGLLSCSVQWSACHDDCVSAGVCAAPDPHPLCSCCLRVIRMHPGWPLPLSAPLQLCCSAQPHQRLQRQQPQLPAAQAGAEMP